MRRIWATEIMSIQRYYGSLVLIIPFGRFGLKLVFEFPLVFSAFLKPCIGRVSLEWNLGLLLIQRKQYW